MINLYYFTRKVLKAGYKNNLDSHHINPINTLKNHNIKIIRN